MSSSRKTMAAAMIALIAASSIAFGQAVLDRPVMVGGEADLDACGGFGVVEGLNPAGDGFLAVRSGPGTNYPKIGELHNGHEIYMCDEAGSGKWHGIVFGKHPKAGDCGVSSPIAQLGPYAGPCFAGWVFHKYVRLIAG